MKHIFTLLISFVILNSSFSQTKSAFVEAADQAFDNKNYYAALKYYDEALLFDENDTLLLYKSAEAARHFDSYKIAAMRYSLLLDSMGYHSEPSIKFYLGEMNQKLGNYEKSTEYYQLYLAEHSGEDEFMTALAEKELESARWAVDQSLETEQLYTLDKYEGNVNTPYSDFGALVKGDTLFFSSMQFKESNPDELPARQMSKVLKGEKSGEEMTVLDVEWNNLPQSTAHTTFSLDGNKMYFTICDYTSASTLRCDIYETNVTEDGSTAEYKKLEINQDSVTNTHPAIGLDPVNGKEALYFVSDRDGGKGGLDIWFSVIDPNLGFSNPVNYESINTNKDEVTPFYHESTNTIYFSSNGRRGFGGFDIFQKSGSKDVVLLDYPLNGSYDDLYLSVDDDQDEFIFSSNREGSLFVDSYYEACCFDIYKAKLNELDINLTALTFNKETNTDLNGAMVRIIDKNTGEEIFNSYLENSNEHIFSLPRNREMLIIGTKENFLPDTVELSTVGIFESKDIVKKLYLDLEKIELDVFTFDKDTEEPLSGVTIVLKEVGNPASKVVVDNPNANDFKFFLKENKRYQITATKHGYFPATLIVNSDENIDGKIRKELFLDKYALEKFLPVVLYFDNDIPDNRSRSTSTKRSYSELLGTYVRRKQEFKDRYCEPLSQSEKEKTCAEIETFFEGDVKGGYDKLKIFMNVLLEELEKGRTIELSIRGYASPRADEKYNLVLSQRRVNSIRNELMTYRGGIISKYLNNKQLLVTDVSYGEELTPKGVEDDLFNERLSIYSPEASKQRRVEIVNVTKF